MTIDIILYMCIYVCGCIIVFDLIFAISVWHNKIVLPKRTVYLKKVVFTYLVIERNNIKYQEKLVTKLSKLLENENWLLTYLYAYNSLKEDNLLNIELLQKFNIMLFRSLAERYYTKNDECKALFSHVVYEIIPASNKIKGSFIDKNKLSRTLISFLNSDSVYVRSNAFRAIVKVCKNANSIFYALAILNSHLQFRDSKIFSDYMLEFNGNINKLISMLLESFYEFSSELQVMIINYLRLLPKSVSQENYYPIIFDILSKPDINGEVVIACIRYFGKYQYKYAYEKLFEFIELDDETNHFNYAAIATNAIRNYPSQRTIDVLSEKLSSQDWFVRFNSADSLLHLNVDYEQIILNSTDKYAKEILIHRSEVYNLRKREKFVL